MRNSGPKFFRAFKLALVVTLSLFFFTDNALVRARHGATRASECQNEHFVEAEADADASGRRKRRPRRKRRRKTSPVRWIHHEIRKGETLGEIAKLYDVKVKNLKRWNHLGGDNIYAGRKLRIKTGVTRTGRTRVVYVVQRGDSFWKIAKHYGTTVADIKKRNRRTMKKRRWRLFPGMELVVFATRLEGVGIPKGTPQRGRLENGQKMPKMKGVVLRRPARSYGAWNTIANLQKCFAQVRKSDRGFPPIIMGSISREGGGRIKPHVSHQNGLDVDIGFIPRKRKLYGAWFDATQTGTLDTRRTWKLMRCFIDTGELEYMFVDYPVQKKLYEFAKKRLKMSASKLARYFQFPRGRRASKSILQHSKGHDDHMHVRFQDPTKRSRRQARQR